LKLDTDEKSPKRSVCHHAEAQHTAPPSPTHFRRVRTLHHLLFSIPPFIHSYLPAYLPAGLLGTPPSGIHAGTARPSSRKADKAAVGSHQNRPKTIKSQYALHTHTPWLSIHAAVASICLWLASDAVELSHRAPRLTRVPVSAEAERAGAPKPGSRQISPPARDDPLVAEPWVPAPLLQHRLQPTSKRGAGRKRAGVMRYQQ